VKKNVVLTVRVPDQTITDLDARAGGDRSAYVRAALLTHGALLDLVAALEAAREGRA
jgi:hypothetical protein